MQDDFAALDLLSVDAFTPFSHPAGKKREKKKRFGKGPKAEKSRELTVLLPLIRDKLRPVPRQDELQGWPVTLSWPTQDKPAPRGFPLKALPEGTNAGA